MANGLLSPTVYAKAGLALLKNNLVMCKKVNLEFTDEFRKVGTTVKAKRYPEFTVGKGRVATVQDVLEGEVTVNLDRQRNVPVKFTSLEETLTVDSLLRSKTMESAMAQLAQQVESELAGIAARGFYSWAGTAGAAINSARDFFYGPQRLTTMAVPMTDRHAILYPDDAYELAGAFTGGTSTSIPSNIADEAIRRATIPMIADVQPVMSQAVYAHTNGTWATAGTREVKGADQSVSYSTASVRNTYTQGLLVDGFSNGATIKVGDKFHIEGVYAVNPRTKATQSYLQQFTVKPGTNGSGGYVADTDPVSGEVDDTAGTYTFSTGGSSEITIQISPPIITSGAYQTVSAAPADNADLTLLGSASVAYNQNLCYHRNAVALCMAKPIAPFTGEFDFATDPDTGIAIRYWRWSEGGNDEHYHRFDVIFGATCIDPRLGTILSGTS